MSMLLNRSGSSLGCCDFALPREWGVCLQLVTLWTGLGVRFGGMVSFSIGNGDPDTSGFQCRESGGQITGNWSRSEVPEVYPFLASPGYPMPYDALVTKTHEYQRQFKPSKIWTGQKEGRQIHIFWTSRNHAVAIWQAPWAVSLVTPLHFIMRTGYKPDEIPKTDQRRVKSCLSWVPCKRTCRMRARSRRMSTAWWRTEFLSLSNCLANWRTLSRKKTRPRTLPN